MSTILLKTIKSARKVELLEIGEKYEISLNARDKKVEIYNTLIEELVERDFLPAEARNENLIDKVPLAYKSKLVELETQKELARMKAEKEKES